MNKKETHMTDFERVIDFDNMYRAYRKAKRGKGYKRSSAKFSTSALDGIQILIEQLRSGTYTVSPYNEFKVYEPKERIIKTTSFKDKVVQHSLCDNVLLPRMERIFIPDNCAGQKGKGTLYALDKISAHLSEFYRRRGRDGYILKCDVSKFFYNIPHDKLYDVVEYWFSYDRDICRLCKIFIDSTDGVGIPLGNQINQGLALLYLDCMDKMITCELGCEFYGRYMDDFYLVHQSKDYLEYCLEAIRGLLDTLGLTLNGKTQIFPIKNGVDYLGFHTYVTADGKIIRKLKNENKRRAMKKYRRMAKLVNEGKLSKEKFEISYGSWKNHISHGNCFALGCRTDENIKLILEEDKENEMSGTRDNVSAKE